MSKIKVIARIVAKPGQEAELRELLRGMLAPTHAEDGCELYELYESHELGRFYFYELWTSKAHLDAHCETPHFKNLVAAGEALFAEAPEINLVEEIVKA
jgi:quinol monooxygenase YgiN